MGQDKFGALTHEQYLIHKNIRPSGVLVALVTINIGDGSSKSVKLVGINPINTFFTIYNIIEI